MSGSRTEPRASASSTQPVFGWGLSTAGNPVAAAEEAAAAAGERAGARADGGPDGPSLVFVFGSGPHAERLDDVAARVRRVLDPACMIGVSAESIIGGRTAIEDAGGVSVLCARLPAGVELSTFTDSDLQPIQGDDDATRRGLARAIGVDDRLAATFLFADPFSMPLGRLLPALNEARRLAPRTPPVGALLGGIASAGRTAGENYLIVNDDVRRAGAVGVSLRGPVRVDPIVSQGCRGFGPQYVVTRAKGNVIFELGGKPAIRATREAVGDLSHDERTLLGHGLLLGQAASEYKEHFGRGDFVIRQVVGADEDSGSIAVGDVVRAGRTVRFHVRDAVSAGEDLALLLDGQKIHGPPAGALVITCNGRGSKLFGRADHDAEMFQRAFDRAPGGEERAKVGDAIDPGEQPSVPMAGFFAAGEIGPVGGESFLHGHTACYAVFRGVES